MDLKIEKSNKFINKRVVKYNLNTNILEFNTEEIDKGYDMKHILMHGLLNIISSNDVQSGFNYNDKFKALNAGYTEILTNNLVGNDSDLSYLDDEVISTNLIASMIGNDVLFEAYFGNDTNKLVNALINEGLENIPEMMNYNHANPNVRIEVDSKIAEKQPVGEKAIESLEQFALWGSMSKEATKIETMINAYKNQLTENTINRTL